MHEAVPPGGCKSQALLQVIDSLIAELADPAALMQALVDGALQLAGGQAAMLWLFEPLQQRLVLRAHQGLDSDPGAVHLPVGEGLGGHVFVSGGPVVEEWSGEHKWTDILGLDDADAVDSLAESLQGLRRIYVVPLAMDERVTGVLMVFSILCEETAAEQQESLYLLQAAAAHGATALEKSQAFERLQRAIKTHDVLTQTALSGLGWQETVDALVDIFGNSVVLEDEGFSLIYTRARPSADREPTRVPDGTPLELLAAPAFQAVLLGGNETGPPVRVPGGRGGTRGPDRVVVPITVAERALGYLTIVEDGRVLAETDMKAVEHAAVVVALELLRNREVHETEERLKREFLADLLRGKGGDSLLRRAALLGYNVEWQYAAMVLRLTPESGAADPVYPTGPIVGRTARAVQAFLQPRHRHSLVIGADTGDVVIFAGMSLSVTPREAREQLRTLAQQIIERVQVQAPGAQLALGLGRVCQVIGELQASYEDAFKALDILYRCGGRQGVVDYDQLAIVRLLLQVTDADELDSFADKVLGGLLGHETRNRAVLLDTLAAYVAHNRHLGRTARALLIHVNTLNYRLQKIQELTGLNFESGDDWLDLQTALRIYYLRQQPDLLFKLDSQDAAP